MARAYAKRLEAELAIVDKRRASPEKTEVMHILGEVKGKTAVLVDDIVATAGSLIEALDALSREGIKDAYAAISHGILSGTAIEKIKNCKLLKEVVITNSVPLEDAKKISKIKFVSIAPLLAEAIRRTHQEESISSLFDVTR